jgi:hypothetical protein
MCSAERSEQRTNAMVRVPVKGARTRSEKSSLLVVPMRSANVFRAEPAEEEEDRVKVLGEG